ncbi:flavin reductase family protein [Streptomyces sp. NPDC127092]|uniref:flavin reductase family protein n=1 Tax=Streptomyces sp. NPDC127092 TaxID=3347135 RepID=UPI003655A3E6
MSGVTVVPADERCLRSVLGRFATGVVAVAARDAVTGERAGLAANSFCSVSLDPPLVSFCVAHTSSSWPRIREAGTLGISILGAGQREAATRLAARGGDKFTGVAWSASPGGAPVLDGALAWLECAIEAEHRAGDHVIVVARVLRLDASLEGEPLLFFRGEFERISR